eukprot:1161071-Pelagomonas_calceolata.AAC.9
MNVLAPHIARLSGAMMEKAEIPACWKMANLDVGMFRFSEPALNQRNPHLIASDPQHGQIQSDSLFEKGSVLDPGIYHMLAVSGILYRLYANVLREVITGWCQEKKDPRH